MSREPEKWTISTISVDGLLSNIVHDEEKFYNQLRIVESDRVICVSCNYFTLWHPNPRTRTYAMLIREPKNKKSESKRQRRGTGREFNSSIAIYIQPDIKNPASKHYEVKLFRTGTIDCLGVLKADFADFAVVVEILTEFLERNLREFEVRHPVPPMLAQVNNYLQTAGEKQIYVSRYIGPIRVVSLKTILQNWIYHVDIDRPRESLKLHALVEYLNGTSAADIKRRFNLSPTTSSIAELSARFNIKIASVSTMTKGTKNISTSSDPKIAKDIKLIFETTRPVDPTSSEKRAPITSKITRYAKVSLSGLRDNQFILDIQGFYFALKLKDFVITSATPDKPGEDSSSESDKSGDDGDESESDTEFLFDIRGAAAPLTPAI